jgi:protein tyrosine phosphatase (PTP) superfamily phosphohydrolase (DUF442 family)
MPVSDSPIANFALVDDALWRGARPNAEGVAWLIAQGVKTIISLELWRHEQPIPGIALIHVADWEPLPALAPQVEDAHIKLFLRTFRTAQKPVFVHCRQGVNRTGRAVAAYRIIEKGEPVDPVIADMKSYGGFWEAADEHYLHGLAERRAEFAA